MLFSKFNKNIFKLSGPIGGHIGAGVGYIYGGPIASKLTRGAMNWILPSAAVSTNNSILGNTGALLWNMHRSTFIEHAGFQAFGLGTKYGAIAGGVTGTAASMATVYAASKAINTLLAYKEHKNNINQYLELAKNNSDVETIEENNLVIVKHAAGFSLV